MANNLLTEHTVEHIKTIKRNKEDLRKINKVRNHKKVIFPYDLVGSIGVALTQCGIDTNEVSSMRCKPSG